MGRSFASVRMGVREILSRWERAARALPGKEREHALRVIAMARVHASECFYAFDDPLEAVLFSVLLEVAKEREEGRGRVDP
ncbi:MAG TPA: hypothetical protein PK069_01990 [Methanolinea sp.]|nr:hypothetical protein [Methanolinea sp.]HQK55039.1 hypothetical protein [Methanolinea sp.]